jgi:hypothetical protein
MIATSVEAECAAWSLEVHGPALGRCLRARFAIRSTAIAGNLVLLFLWQRFIRGQGGVTLWHDGVR